MQTSAVIADLMSQAPVQGVGYATGRAAVDAEGSGPGQIVFVQVGGSYEPAERHTGSNPRAIMTRVVRYDAYCWGADQDSAEALLNSLCAAIHLATGDFRLVSDRNLESLPDADDTITEGVAIVLSFDLRVPVTLPADQSVTAVASNPLPGTSTVLTPQSVSMQFQNGHVVTGTPAP